MRTGSGLGMGLAKTFFIALVLGLTWAGDLLGSTDTSQFVKTLNHSQGYVSIPSNALVFGTTPADATGVLRFPATSTVVNRRKADNLANLDVLKLTASDGITLGDAAGGVVTVQGSKVSLTAASTEKAFVDANGLTVSSGDGIVLNNLLLGAAPRASTGQVRGPKADATGFSIMVRNSGDTANLTLISAVSNLVQVGDAANVGNTHIRSTNQIFLANSTGIFETGLSLSSWRMSGYWTLEFGEAAVTPLFRVSPRTSNAACANLTVRSQGPYASASGANRNPGNVILEVPAAASGGTEGKVQALIASVSHAEIDGTIADGETALLLRRNVGGAFSLQRVSMGATDSGGSGFKLLRVVN